MRWVKPQWSIWEWIEWRKNSNKPAINRYFSLIMGVACTQCVQEMKSENVINNNDVSLQRTMSSLPNDILTAQQNQAWYKFMKSWRIINCSSITKNNQMIQSFLDKIGDIPNDECPMGSASCWCSHLTKQQETIVSILIILFLCWTRSINCNDSQCNKNWKFEYLRVNIST